MIHYYGMMNYLALSDVESALVEARKANSLLRRYANDNPGRSFTNPAALQYIAGMLQWSAGDDNDAIVSLRQYLAQRGARLQGRHRLEKAHHLVRTEDYRQPLGLAGIGDPLRYLVPAQGDAVEEA